MKCLKMRQSINTCIAQPIQTAYIYTCITEEMKASQLCCTHTIEREAFVHFDVTLTKKTTTTKHSMDRIEAFLYM